MESREMLAARKFLALHKYVKRCALAVVPLEDYSEDIAQQVFVEFMAKTDQWDLEGDLKPLLARMTRMVAGKFWRERAKTLPPMFVELAKQLQRSMQESLDADLTADSHQQELDALRICLEKLPAKSRELIHSYYFEEISTDEIARQRSIFPGSVNRSIWRIRQKLHDCIQFHRGKPAPATAYRTD